MKEIVVAIVKEICIEIYTIFKSTNHCQFPALAEIRIAINFDAFGILGKCVCVCMCVCDGNET